MQQANDDQCLDDHPVKTKKSDFEVREYLHQLGISNASTLQQMDKENRNLILSKLKKMDGVTIRQLSRITGISKSVIDRVR